MRKRILATLLSVIMIIGLFPLTVFAATCNATIRFKVIPVYLDDSVHLGYDVDYDSAWEGTLPCTYSTTHSANANHQIAIKGFHPQTINLQVREGYEWVGWEKYSIDLDGVKNPQFKTYFTFSSATTNVTGTGTHYIYMVYHLETPTQPTAPSDSELKGLLENNAVTVDCINEQVNHGGNDPITYGLLENSYTTGTVTGSSSSGYTYTITVNPDLYVTEYNKTNSGHTLDSSSPDTGTITLKWNESAWKVDSGAPVTFNVTCPTPPTVEEDWENVYLDIQVWEKGAEQYIQHSMIEYLFNSSDKSNFNSEAFRNTVEFASPILNGTTWTMEVTVHGYQANDQKPYTYAVNYLMRATKYNGWVLAEGEDDTKTVTLTYYDKPGTSNDGWYNADGENAVMRFDIEPPTTPSAPAITDFDKELVTSKPDDVTIPDGVTITYPGTDKVTIPADGEVTLLYKLTVTGKAGASFTITDDSATLVGSDCSATQNGNVITGTIPTGQTAATIYVIKTFTADDIDDSGNVTNQASISTDDEGGVAEGEGDATETTPAEEGKPSAPGEDNLPEDLKTGAVKVNCTNTDVNHPDAIYGLIMGGYASNVTGTAADGWECIITIDTDAYAAHYDLQKGYAEGTHTATTAPAPTITLTWNKTEKAWELKQGTTLPVTVEVECTTPTAPDPTKPDEKDIPGILGAEDAILIKCNAIAEHSKSYALWPDTDGKNRYEVGDPVKGTDGTWTCVVTLLPDVYVEQFSQDYHVTHWLDPKDQAGVTIPLTWDSANQEWKAPDKTEGYWAKFTVSCVPDKPADDDIPGIVGADDAILVKCVNDNPHDAMKFDLWKNSAEPEAERYEVANPAYNAETNTWTCVVTILPDVYVGRYNDLTEVAHRLLTEAPQTVTLTWDPVEQEWNAEPLAEGAYRATFEVTCAGLYTLTYNANGGTFGNGTEFTVDNIVLNTSYELGKENNYTNPTKDTDVFLGWTTDTKAIGQVYGAGDQLPTVVPTVDLSKVDTVYAVWGEDTNDDGIADAKQIMIQPADITIYTGGDSYAGVVNGSGELTSNTGLPEPGYYFTLPYELNEYLRDLTGAEESQPVNLAQYIRLDDTSDDQREWVLALYDGELTSIANGKYIYRMVKEGNGPAKLEIRDDQGNIVTNDKFEISNAALYQEYAMSLDDSAVDNGKIAVQVKVSGDWKDLSDITVIDTKDMELGLAEGTLTVRGTDTSTPTVTTDVVTDADAISEANADIVAVAGEDVNYTINGSTVNTDGQIGLYTDGLLPNTVLDTYLKNKGLTDANTQVDYQYLDLVDTNNGNAYVTTNKDLDIYWKLPADADASGDFYVVHFNGLDRNYDVTDLENLVNAYGVTVYSKANNNLEVVTIGGEQYLKFATSTFSPFALVYDTQVEEPVPETVTVAFESGKHGDFGQYHVTGAYVEVVKGERLNRADIPTVYEDTDYEFIGWYKQGSNSWYLYSDAQLLKMTFDSDATFIAQYKHVGDSSVDDEYDVVYNANFTDGGVPRRQGYDKGETVTVSENKWFERDGYIFVGWNTEADGTGDSYDPDDTFKMPGRDVYLYAQWQKEKPGPDDTGVSRWLETENHNAYLTGYPDSTFGADRNMTRAEVAQMFYALLKNKNVMITTSFSDVSNDAWYATAVKTMASLGMMSGYPDGTFRPDEPITRAEFATVALAFAYEPDNARCSYLDVSTSAWYYPYVAQATTYGWIGGYPGGTFRPNNSITRVEVCVIVNNMLGRTPDEDYIDRNEDELVNFVDLSDRYWGYYTIMEATNGHEYTGNYSNETWESAK